jgi:hypothetical protein
MPSCCLFRENEHLTAGALALASCPHGNPPQEELPEASSFGALFFEGVPHAENGVFGELMHLPVLLTLKQTGLGFH